MKTLLFLACILFTPALYAEEKAVIIVSEDVDISDMSKTDLQNIFLGRKTLWEDGKKIQISLSNEDEAMLNKFLAQNVGKTQRRYKKYWLKKVFAGYGVAPKIFTNNEKAIEYVKDQEHAIAFVMIDDTQIPNGLKIVSIEGKEYFN